MKLNDHIISKILFFVGIIMDSSLDRFNIDSISAGSPWTRTYSSLHAINRTFRTGSRADVEQGN